MGRPRLTDEEREARRKARVAHSFSDAAYKHYDTTEGLGSVDDWMRAAETLLGARSSLVRGKPAPSADLALLGLDTLPQTVALLKTAYRNSLFIYHPDHGGTDAQAIAARDAFERLLKNYN